MRINRSSAGRGLVFAATIMLLVFTAACAPHSDADVQRTATPLTRSADSLRAAAPSTAVVDAFRLSLDSCNMGHYPSDPPGTSMTRSSTWATGVVRSVGRVSIFVPDSAQLTVSDTALGAFSLAFRDCPRCRFAVAVTPDTAGKGIEGLVAALIAEQRAVDSVNKDPKNGVEEFNVIDGPPTPIMVAGERGYVIDDDCGDCADTRIVFGRPGYIATVHISSDDDTPMGGRHACEMTALGRTFRWGN